MGSGEDPLKKMEAYGLLAALEAGITAALILLAWLALASAWYRRSIRTAANIMATTFCGEAAMGQESKSRTAAGLALYLVLYGIIGALFGPTLASRDASFRTTPIGVLVGLGWYYLSFAILWQNINPLITLYTHRGPLMAPAASGAATRTGEHAA
jgi:hypothetical protein